MTAPSTVLVTQSCTNLPYGDAQNCTGPGPDVNQLHFTGKERDTESGNDYFGARYYASSMGRWLTPDWSSKVEPVPYARLDDPQTLNLYAYVGNNPLSDADADGHTCLWCDIMAHDGAWIGNLLKTVFLKNQKQAQKDESAKSTLQNDQKNQQQTLPNDPSGLGSGWKEVTPTPGGKVNPKIPRRFRGPKGTEIEFDPANPDKSPRAKGGKNHWHEIDPATGKRTDQHLLPGDPIPGPDGQLEGPASNASSGTSNFISNHAVGIGVVVVGGAILLAPVTDGASLLLATQ